MTTMTSKTAWPTTTLAGKEVIIIDDSPPPPMPSDPRQVNQGPIGSRTRARTAKRAPPADVQSRSPQPKRRKHDIAKRRDQANHHQHHHHHQHKHLHHHQSLLPSPPKPSAAATTKTPSSLVITGSSKNKSTASSRQSRPAPKVPQQPHHDDKDGYYIVKPNGLLTERYKMLRLLGQGTFGRVVECFDRKQRTYCAIKIIRSVQKYRDASHVEIKILNRLKTQDPSNRNKCIHLREWFDYENHICMVFDLFDLSIFDFLKSNNFRPFPLAHIQQIAKQLLTSIAFLHSLKVIHTDIKPENILLVSSAAVSQSSNSKTDTPPYLTLKSTDIRVIDFGSATDEKGPNCTVVSTRHYRAPEIILGTGWSYPCDIWSIGCVLVEMFTGNALFQTHDNLEHLAMMESVLGKFPEFMVQMSLLNGQTYFRDNLTLAYPTTTTPKNSIKYVRQLKPLHQIVKRTQTHGHLLDLLKRMLDYSPNKRITAREALRHPFFQTKM